MKKGFTLVELLAVILILGIVAIFAMPIIGDVLNDSKENANLRSIEGYARSIKQEYYNQSMEGKTPVIDETFLSNVDKSGGDIACESIKYSDDYGVIMYKCKFTNTDKEYCYAKEKHYACDNSEFLEIYNNPDVAPGGSGSPGDSGSNSENDSEEIGYKDNSGANKPELLDNFVPIKYDGANWIVADITQEWYNYDTKEWANAVVLNTTKNVGEVVNESDIDLWYVWIPRYKYQLFNVDNGNAFEQEIQIEFENGTATTGTVKCSHAVSGSGSSSETCTSDINDNWYTHPAFTFGTQELTGFWVGKFEVSTTDNSCNSNPDYTNCDKSSHTLTIKPNVSSLRYTNVSNFFTTIQNISNKYSINGDSHMMKNMEWGAVAYLSHSKYGINKEVGINNNSNYTTGCGAQAGSSSTTSCDAYSTANGMLASTTGNIYGVYDMSGGANEYVMGNIVNSSGQFYLSSSGFSEASDAKYYDNYTYNIYYTTHGRGKLGDATKETLRTFGDKNGGWYDDNAYFPSMDFSWFIRGGNYDKGASTGVFGFHYYYGNAGPHISARGVLSVRE